MAMRRNNLSAWTDSVGRNLRFTIARLPHSANVEKQMSQEETGERVDYYGVAASKQSHRHTCCCTSHAADKITPSSPNGKMICEAIVRGNNNSRRGIVEKNAR